MNDERRERVSEAAERRAEEQDPYITPPEIPARQFRPLNLKQRDVAQVVRQIPRALRRLMSGKWLPDSHQRDYKPEPIYISGGAVRACVAGEDVSDIDVVVGSRPLAHALAEDLCKEWWGSYKGAEDARKVIVTQNAITVLNPHGGPVAQFITRWCYKSAYDILPSFDFTVCQAAVWYHEGQWVGLCSDEFYPDLAAKRLVYTNPVRDEAPGGSIMRAFKYTRRGYYLDLPSLALLIHRINGGVDRPRAEALRISEANIILSLLVEVDPSLAHVTGVADPTLV